jgi:hypothetical protein
MEVKRKGLWPALILFFLAPVIGELLSGSSPPAEFFNPFSLLCLAALYGSGAILIHELRVRWDKGWLTVFALGVAYGIIEEGLMVKSFFDPGWVDLGALGTYGRWAGVNWVWSLELTIYHAMISISIPILLTELLFPAQRYEHWLGCRGMVGLSILMLADILFGFFFLTPYRPPIIPYGLAIIVVVVLYWLARRLPPDLAGVSNRPGLPSVPRARWFTMAGFGATFFFFFINWGWPSLGIPVLITMLAVVGLAFLVFWGARRMSQHGAWSDEHHLALVSGALGFFVLLAPLQELDRTRPDNTAGMALVGLVTLLLLVWLWFKVRRSNPTNILPTHSITNLHDS